MVPDIDEAVNDTGKFLRILADESHPVDRHCRCGRVLLDPWCLQCEHCEAAAAHREAA
jgi:hypothetical protein